MVIHEKKQLTHPFKSNGYPFAIYKSHIWQTLLVISLILAIKEVTINILCSKPAQFSKKCPDLTKSLNIQLFVARLTMKKPSKFYKKLPNTVIFFVSSKIQSKG